MNHRERQVFLFDDEATFRDTANTLCIKLRETVLPWMQAVSSPSGMLAIEMGTDANMRSPSEVWRNFYMAHYYIQLDNPQQAQQALERFKELVAKAKADLNIRDNSHYGDIAYQNANFEWLLRATPEQRNEYYETRFQWVKIQLKLK